MGGLFFCEISQYLASKQLVDLVMARNWLCSSRSWVVINVVFASMSQKHRTGRFDLGNQISSFHANSNSSTFLIPRIALVEKVS